MTPARRNALIAIVVAASFGALGAWLLFGPTAVEAVPVARGDLVQTVVVSGRVESPRRVDLGSAVTGTVAEVPVAEGERVRAGQLLVRLDESEAKAAVDQARTAIAQAEARLAQLRSTSEPVAREAARQAQANFDNAERQLARQRELFARGFIGQAGLDEAQRARDVAESQWRSAGLQRESAAPGGSDFRLAETALAQARANLNAALARLELLTIEAPVDGVLIARNVERGNVVQPGKSLLTLSPDGATQLVVQVDEKNLNLLGLGQHALASADAYARERFEASVTYINPGIDPLRGTVEVKLDVPRPPPYLLQDMTVSVDIEVARKRAVLTLPAEAVRDAATASPWALVAEGGRARRRDVALGARGTALVEIASGLREGELAIPSTEAAVGDGRTIRIARIAKRAGTS